MSLPDPLPSRRLILAGMTAFGATSLAGPAFVLAQPAANSEPVPSTVETLAPDWINALAVSPDGRLLAAASTSHAIAVWEIATGKLLQTFIFPMTQNSVGALMVSDDGKMLVVGNAARRRGSKGMAIIAYDIESGDQQEERAIDLNWVGAFATAPKATKVATIGHGSDRSVRLWDKAGLYLEWLWPAHDSALRAVAMSHDGGRIATAGSNWRKTGRDPSLKIWDTKTGQMLHKMAGHSEGAKALAFSADGRRLVSVGTDAVKVWSVANGRLIGSIGHKVAANQSVDTVVIAPGGEWFVMTVGNGDGNSITSSIRASASGRIMHLWSGPAQTDTQFAASPDGTTLFTGGNDGEIEAREVKSGRAVRTFKLDDTAARTAADADRAKREQAVQ